MTRMKMTLSEFSKTSLAEQFGFKNIELTQIENFMNNNNQKTAKDMLDALVEDRKLSMKQKIVVAYVVGNSARDAAMQEDVQKGLRIDMSGNVPPIGG